VATSLGPVEEQAGSNPKVRVTDDTELHDDKPTSRRKGISTVVGPNALTSVDFRAIDFDPNPSHLLVTIRMVRVCPERNIQSIQTSCLPFV
jgi:hypothetical protein